jgi:guanylate kinase
VKDKMGLLIVFSGPSGVGKSTVRKVFFQEPNLNLVYSISMTTRPIRLGEVEGVDYFFVTKDEFMRNIKEGNLLEYAEFVGNYYGTPKNYVDQLRKEGKNVVLEIEVNGAEQVLAKCPDAISIFLLPPSFDELEKRIRTRKTEADEVILQRLNKARREMNMKDRYSHVVVNKEIEVTAKEIKDIIESYIKR